MPNQYDSKDFKDVSTKLKAIKPVKKEKYTAYELVAHLHDDIQAAEQRGVPLEAIYEVLQQRELKIGFVTFRSYWRSVKSDRQKAARRLKYEERKARASASVPSKVTSLNQGRRVTHSARKAEA